MVGREGEKLADASRPSSGAIPSRDRSERQYAEQSSVTPPRHHVRRESSVRNPAGRVTNGNGHGDGAVGRVGGNYSGNNNNGRVSMDTSRDRDRDRGRDQDRRFGSTSGREQYQEADLGGMMTI